MFQLGVMGKQNSQTIEWTLEHHKLFVDTLLRHGGFEKVRARASGVRDEVIKRVKGLTRGPMLYHVRQFQQLQKETRSLLCSRKATPQRKSCCKLSVLVDDLMRDLKGLNMEPKLSTWTLEHHKRVVDAVTKLGGLDVAKPMEKLAVSVLRVMEEERRQGLTVWILTKHLRRLRDLQRGTQEAIVEAAVKKAQHGRVRRPKKVKLGRRRKNDDQFLPRTMEKGAQPHDPLAA